MTTQAIVLEAIVIIVFALSIITCYKRGFLSSLISLFGYLIACAGAYIGSRALAETVYQMFLRDKMVLNVQTTITSNISSLITGDFSVLSDFSLENILDVVPRMFQWLVSIALKSASISDFAANSIPEMSEKIVDNLIYPSVIVILQSAMFFVLFIALLVIVKIAIKFFKNANKIPVIGTANALLGGITGFAEAFVIMMLLSSLLKVIFAARGDFSFLSQADVTETKLFGFFYNRDFLEILNQLPAEL